MGRATRRGTMTELDRATRQDLHLQAQQLLDHATYLLSARHTCREQAATAREALGSRPREITLPAPGTPGQHVSEPSESAEVVTGHLLPLWEGHAPTFRAILDGTHVAHAPPMHSCSAPVN